MEPRASWMPGKHLPGEVQPHYWPFNSSIRLFFIYFVRLWQNSTDWVIYKNRFNSHRPEGGESKIIALAGLEFGEGLFSVPKMVVALNVLACRGEEQRPLHSRKAEAPRNKRGSVHLFVTAAKSPLRAEPSWASHRSEMLPLQSLTMETKIPFPS